MGESGEASIEATVLAALLLASTLSVGTAAAQPARSTLGGSLDHGSLAPIKGCGSEQEKMFLAISGNCHAGGQPADESSRHLLSI